MSESCQENDMINQRIAWLLWGVPLGLFLAGTFAGPLTRTLLWAPALFIAGGACIVNALRCRRLHCYLTGPLFLVVGALTMFRGFEVVLLPWPWIAAAVVGGTFLAHVPEWITGKYRTGECAAGERR